MFKKLVNNFCFVFCLLIFIKASLSVDIRCSYYNNDYVNAILGKIYRCFVQDELNIISSESAEVKSVSGYHQSSKDNDQVIGFYSNGKNVQYIPKNLDKFFRNLKVIDIMNGRVKEIHQSDMKSFPKLVYAGFMDNDIEILENDLFDFNPDLELVSFWKNKILIIGSNVFDKLSKLTWLYLDSNRCINMRSEGVVSLTKYIIRHAKYNCKDPEIITNDKSDDPDKDFENWEMVQATINELKENITSINGKIANIEENSIQMKAELEKILNHSVNNLWIVIVVFVAFFVGIAFIVYKKLIIYR